MATKQATATKPTTAAVQKVKAVALKAAKANGTSAVDQILAAIDALPKGSDELKKVRNRIYAKIARKEADPEIKKVLNEIVGLKGFPALKLAYLAVRREQPKADAEKAEATGAEAE